MNDHANGHDTANDQPQRPPIFVAQLILDLSDKMVEAKATNHEASVIAAQLCGLCLARMIPVEHNAAQTVEVMETLLDSCVKMMRNTAYGMVSMARHEATNTAPSDQPA